MPISYLHAKFEQNRSINGKIPIKAAAAFVWPLMVKATKQTKNGCQLAICTPNLNKIGQKMAEMHLKAAAAFVWPLLVKTMKRIENGC